MSMCAWPSACQPRVKWQAGAAVHAACNVCGCARQGSSQPPPYIGPPKPFLGNCPSLTAWLSAGFSGTPQLCSGLPSAQCRPAQVRDLSVGPLGALCSKCCGGVACWLTCHAAGHGSRLPKLSCCRFPCGSCCFMRQSHVRLAPAPTPLIMPCGNAGRSSQQRRAPPPTDST